MPAALVLAALLQSGELPAFLRYHAALSKAETATLERGEPVAQVFFGATDATEIGAFGAIRVKVAREALLSKYADIATFKKAKEVLQIGKFHSPPRLEDLDALTLDADEIAALKGCARAACSMKMTGAMIDRLRKEIDWSSPKRDTHVTALYRRLLFEYAAEYAAKGNAALAEYADKEEALRLADQFRSLVADSRYLAEAVPELRRHLDSYPTGRLPRAEEFLYWSKEKFGFKPVVSLTHVTIYRDPPGERGSVVIASKQIYASHYFKTSLGMSALSAPAADGTSTMMYVNRSRVDLLGGFLSFVKRWIAKRRLRDGMEGNLQAVKRKLEAGS